MRPVAPGTADGAYERRRRPSSANLPEFDPAVRTSYLPPKVYLRHYCILAWAKKVLELSLREALQLGHNYIGTEHILLGLIREGEGVAAQVLVKLGADLSRVRQQVIQVLSSYAGGKASAEEAGARTRLVRMTVPEELRQAEVELAQVRRDKEAAIEAEDFEQAAGLRDQERQLARRVAERERAWTAGVDLEAVVRENQNLHGEIKRLRELLRRHGIEPGGETPRPG